MPDAKGGAVGERGGEKKKGIIYTAVLKIDWDLSLKITFKKLTLIVDIFFIVTFTILPGSCSV